MTDPVPGDAARRLVPDSNTDVDRLDAVLATLREIRDTLKNKSEEPAPLVVGTRGLCNILQTSEATVHRLRSSGKLLKPLELGSQLRWRVAEVNAWVEAGCPELRTWEALRKAKGFRD
jgi:predicted DNA-binding transcriptional regulator AlpA